MEHMALVLDSYQLLDDPDQTISLMMGDKTQPLYAGTHQPPPATTSHHQPPPATTSHHQPPPAATSHHQPPPATISHHPVP
jgi:hypothetical protein